MIDWLHKKAKTRLQWVLLDFFIRVISLVVLIALGIYFLPDIIPSLYIINMNSYAWILTIVLSLLIVAWGLYSYRFRKNNFQDKLSHHHYKTWNHKARKPIWISLYKIFISVPVTSFFCLVFLPALMLHFSPFHDILTLVIGSILYPLEFIFIEGHSARHFFWQTIACLWILMITYVIRSFVFPVFMCMIMSVSQLYASKRIA
jgi:hypothetical protein